MTITTQVREYFNENYPHIHFDMSDKQIEQFMNQAYIQRLSFNIAMNCLYDYILAGGGQADE